MKKTLKILAVFLIVLIAIVWLSLDPIATRITRKALASSLNAPATLDGISISLLRGKVDVKGLTIAQPDGFGEGNAFALRRASVNVDVSSLFQGNVHIENIEVDAPRVHIVKMPNGSMNLSALAKMEEEEKAPSEKPKKEKPDRAFSLLLESLKLGDGIIRFSDHTKGTQAVDIVVSNLVVDVKDIQVVQDKKPTEKEGSAQVHLDILQKAGTNATALVAARIAPLDLKQDPTVAAIIRLSGFELTTAGPLPGKDVIGFLGGYGIDLTVNAQVAPGLLKVNGGIINEYGQSTDFLSIRGNIQEPKVEMASVLSGALNLPVAALSATAGNVAHTAVAAAGTVLDTGATAVTGALSTVGSLAGGLLSSGEKLLQGDISGAGSELAKGATNTVSAAVGTVGDTLGTAAKGLSEAADTAIGGKQLPQWRSEHPARTKAWFAEAQKWLAETPFPPTAAASPAN